MPSGISEEPGFHGVSVHLCGVSPDTYPEVVFGKVEGKATQKILHEYASGTPDDVAYPDARGWFLGIINQEHGDNHYLISGRPIPEQGDERESFHEVLLEYDGQTMMARAFLQSNGGWRQLGEAESLVRGLTQVELKTIDVTPLHGTLREARFDDFRLYPNPRHTPVRIVVIEDRPAKFPSTAGVPYGIRYHGPQLRLALYTGDGAHRVSEGYTDPYGVASLPVGSPRWVAFPVSAMVRVFRGRKEVGRSYIKAHGVSGLYPGDVWVLDASQMP